MNTWQIASIILYGLGAGIGGLAGLKQSKQKNTHGLTPFLFIYGAFVWADMAVFGMFWFFVALATLVLNDWWLFFLVISLFWSVRSSGEITYWLNQQFSTLTRVSPKDSWLYSFFPNDSVWFVYQTIWQTVLVIALLASIFTGFKWIQTV